MTDPTHTTDADGEHSDATEQRSAVRERYSRIATESSSCCDTTGSRSDLSTDKSRNIGYSDADLDAVEGDANLNLGWGNPTAIASLEGRDTVLEIGRASCRERV